MTDDFYEMATDLEQAAQIDGTELGEWWAALAGLVPSVIDGASEEFLAAFEKEIRAQHKRLKEEFYVEETTETKTVTYRRLKSI